MCLTFSQGLFLLLAIYPSTFLIFALFFGRAYMKSRPDGTSQKEMGEFDRQEGLSQTMAGFALTGLTLLITLFSQRLASVEDLLIFFSIAVMLEMFSAFATHFRIRRAWKYLGFVLQYTGLLSIILGFTAFFHEEIPNSPLVGMVHVVFIVGFFVLTQSELYFDYKLWRIKIDTTVPAKNGSA